MTFSLELQLNFADLRSVDQDGRSRQRNCCRSNRVSDWPGPQDLLLWRPEAREDISRLFDTIDSLESLLKQAQAIPSATRLSTSEGGFRNPAAPVKLLHLELDRLNKVLEAPKLNRKAGNLLQRLKWPFQKDDVERIVRIIENHKSSFSIELGLEALNIQAKHFDILTSIQQDIQEAQSSRQHSQIIKWLARSLPDPSKYHNSARQKHDKSTGTWLTQKYKLKNWITTDNSFLWLNGGAGAGKSVLCSTVIEHLKTISRNQTHTFSAVVYWYYSFDDEGTQNLSNMLCSIVKDLCSKVVKIPDIIGELYSDLNNGQQRPTTENLLKILKALLGGFDHVYLVIDALDECPRSSRDGLLESIKSIRSLGSGPLHFFVTSRRESDIQMTFDIYERDGITFQDVKAQGKKIQRDIEKYIEHRFLSGTFKKWTTAEQETVKTRLANQADGMFRLVALQLDALSLAKSSKKRKEALDELPTTLDDFYFGMVNGIPEEYNEMARKALIWLSYSARPLTLREISEAVLIQPESPYLDLEERFDDDDDILSIFPAGLVKIVRLSDDPTTDDIIAERVREHHGLDPEALHTSAFVDQNGQQRKRKHPSPLVQFAHYSVKEYLVSQRSPERYRVREQPSHPLLAEACFAYLLFAGHREKPEPLKQEIFEKFPLLRYVCGSWTQHMDNLVDGSTERIKEMAIELFRNSTDALSILVLFVNDTGPYFSSSFERARDKPRPSGVEASWHSSWSNFFGKTNDASCKVSSWLAMAGLSSILKTLLDENLIPLPEMKDKLIEAAVRGNQLDTAKLLFGEGFDVNFKPGQKCLDPELTPLRTAIQHASPETVEWLFSVGADIHHEEQEGEVGLLELIRTRYVEGRLDVMRALISAGADVNFCGCCGPSTVSLAADGNLAEMKLLLDSGADVHASGKDMMSVALQKGHISIAKLLLDRGFDVARSDYNVILHALASDHIDIREFVLLLARNQIEHLYHGTIVGAIEWYSHPINFWGRSINNEDLAMFLEIVTGHGIEIEHHKYLERTRKWKSALTTQAETEKKFLYEKGEMSQVDPDLDANTSQLSWLLPTKPYLFLNEGETNTLVIDLFTPRAVFESCRKVPSINIWI